MASLDKMPWIERLFRRIESVAVNEIGDAFSLAVVDDLTRKVIGGDVGHCNNLYLDIGSNGFADMAIVTNENNLVVRFGVASAAQTVFYLYEDAVFSSPGTLLVTESRNRALDVQFTADIYSNPTISNNGLSLAIDYLPGGQRNRSVGASNNDTNAWVLKANSNYLVRCSNTSGGNENVNISLDYYEDVP